MYCVSNVKCRRYCFVNDINRLGIITCFSILFMRIASNILAKMEGKVGFPRQQLRRACIRVKGNGFVCVHISRFFVCLQRFGRRANNFFLFGVCKEISEFNERNYNACILRTFDTKRKYIYRFEHPESKYNLKFHLCVEWFWAEWLRLQLFFFRFFFLFSFGFKFSAESCVCAMELYT